MHYRLISVALLGTTAWLAAKQTTEAISAHTAQQVQDAAAAKTIRDAISAGERSAIEAQRQRRLAEIKEARRLAGCTAGQAVMPDGVSCGTTIDGCRAGRRAFARARAGREVAGSD